MDTQEGFWKTRSGHLVKITKMSDEHLINAINMLKRTAPGMHKLDIETAWDGLVCTHGEMAEMAIEYEIDRLENESDEEYIEGNEKYQELTAEAERRGLWQYVFIIDPDEL